MWLANAEIVYFQHSLVSFMKTKVMTRKIQILKHSMDCTAVRNELDGKRKCLYFGAFSLTKHRRIIRIGIQHTYIYIFVSIDKQEMRFVPIQKHFDPSCITFCKDFAKWNNHFGFISLTFSMQTILSWACYPKQIQFQNVSHKMVNGMKLF